MKCVCGCGRRSAHGHHVVYRQELERVAGRERSERRRLVKDPRNLVPMSFDCHGAHHGRSKPLPLRVLPDSVFEFAAEVLGPDAAFEYLRRRYQGGDPRLDALLT